MFSHRSFLVLGGQAADIVSLVKGGLEILTCNFTFQQGVDDRGKVTTRVHGGSINLTLAQLPPVEIIQWSLGSRKYEDGMIVMLDSENMPVERIIFNEAACTEMNITYTDSGDTYAATRLVIKANTIIVGEGVDIYNEWTF